MTLALGFIFYSLIAGDISSPSAASIDLGRMYLNHVVYAKNTPITVDGKTEDWINNTDALFIGSETQAQISMRFAYDDDKVYFLVERLDEYLTESDQEEIFISGEGNTYYLIKFGTDGIASVNYNDGERMSAAQFEGIKWQMTFVGGVGDKDRDIGKILEFSIPREKINVSDGYISFNDVLYNKDKTEKPVSDTFSCVDVAKRETWQRVCISK